MNGFLHRWCVPLLLGGILLAAAGCSRTPEPIREAAVAGSFYPADASELRAQVKGFLEGASAPQVSGRLLAVMAPHAGYVYCGAIAGETYRQLQGRNVHTVVIIGPSHKSSFQGVSVFAAGTFRTPLGDVPVNTRLASALLDEKADVGFYPGPHELEHSLETQIPFIQVALGARVQVVPILVGNPTRNSYQHLISMLGDILARDEGVSLVISTDLSHYHDYESAVRMDEGMLAPLKSIGLEEAQGLVTSGKGEMCGAWPVIYAMGTLRNLGANKGVLYRYANSGDVTGDRNRVVGYAAMGFYRTPLTQEDARVLLNIADETIRQYVSAGKTPEFEVENSVLRSYQGVFVTINRQGRLRGCIGSLTPMEPLYKGVARNAVRAAAYDSRFPPMRPEELSDMEVEVSVLTPFIPLAVSESHSIVIGRDGLFLQKDGKSGVFLPQVPVEQGWDRETYLNQLCTKAGLPAGAWKAEGAKLYTFRAEVLRDT